MQQDQFKQLIERYIAGDCNDQEIKELSTLLHQPVYIEWLSLIMDGQLEQNQAKAGDFPQAMLRIKMEVEARLAEESPVKHTPVRSSQLIRTLSRKWAIAASLLILISLFAIQYIGKKDNGMPQANNNMTAEPAQIEPGKEGAILTLADGSMVVLDSMDNGLISTQMGSNVRLEDGKLIYEQQGSDPANIAYNTIHTPKGRQFSIQLEDDTRVWLNAESSLRYPVAFTGNDRNVQITGEAYFEVARDNARKFKVIINPSLSVEVLGTHFNINAYSNESMVQTTLLEGSVRVISQSEQKIIRPGQQAQLHQDANGRLQVKTEVNISRVMAWKNGQFDFNNASLYEVMRQLERWYNIEVEYAPGVKNYEFVGKMDRGLSLQEVLKGLAMSEVRFELTADRKIIVKP